MLFQCLTFNERVADLMTATGCWCKILLVYRTNPMTYNGSHPRDMHAQWDMDTLEHTYNPGYGYPSGPIFL